MTYIPRAQRAVPRPRVVVPPPRFAGVAGLLHAVLISCAAGLPSTAAAQTADASPVNGDTVLTVPAT